MAPNPDPEAVKLTLIRKYAGEFATTPWAILETMPGDWYDVLLAMDLAKDELTEINRQKAEFVREARKGRRG